MFVILLLISLLVINTVNGFSACDEIDITFVIDTNNVIHNADAVIEFIVSIINDGSSEQTGFSVVLYDDKMPNNFDIKLIALDDTASITQRYKAEAEVENILERKFKEIAQFTKSGKKGKKVELLDAFKVGNQQLRPERDFNYKTRLGYAADDKTIIGGHDDDKVYFIFDYYNRLIDNDMSDICQLFHHLDTNAVANDDETIHFLLGQMFTKAEIGKIYCKNKKPEQIKWNTFYEFEDELIFNKDIMEQIFDITCPATIQAPKFGGSMNLGNHVQWLDIEAVMKCNLVYYNFGSKTRQDQLDITRAYIQVKDFLNDDNTFKKNDYLLTIEKNLNAMEKMGCTAPVVKIVKIKKQKKIYDKGKPKQYQILKLYITLPKSPMEYLLDCKIKGNEGINVDDQHIDKYNNPYNSAYNDQFYGVSIEAAGIQYANSLSEDEMYEYVNNGMNKAITYIDDEYLDEFGDELYEDAIAMAEMESIYEFYNLVEEDFDMFDDKDIEELYEIYDEYMYWKYGIEWPSLSMPSWAKSGLSYVKKKASGAYNSVKKTAAAGYNYGKKKVQQAKEYGKKKLEQAKQVAVKVGKAALKHTVNAVGKVAKVLGVDKLNIKKTKHLKDLAFKGDYKWEKTATATRSVKGASGMTVRAKGMGRVTINYGYSFDFKMSVSFDFDWEIFKGNTKIDVRLHGNWELMAYANIQIYGKLDVIIKNILNYGHTFTIWVYGVPVVVRPYVRLDKKLKMIPIEVYAGIRCTYGQKFMVGYIYDNTVKPKKSHSIKKITTLKKNCKREFRLQESQNEGKTCPVAKLGFDIIAEATIGLELYYIINANLKFQFVIPFRITLPEKNLKYCRKSGDFCATSDKSLFASFTYSMKLNIYKAAYVDTSKLTNVVKGLFKKQKPKPQKLPQPKGSKAGSMTILPKRSLGCIKLSDTVKVLNDFYRKQCCDGNKAAEGVNEEGDTEVSTLNQQGEEEEEGGTEQKGEKGSKKSKKTASKKSSKPKRRKTKPKQSRGGTSKKKTPSKKARSRTRSRKRSRSRTSTKKTTPSKKSYRKKTIPSKRKSSKTRSTTKKTKKARSTRKKTRKKTGMYCDKRVGRWRDRASGRFVKGPTKCVKSTSKTRSTTKKTKKPSRSYGRGGKTPSSKKTASKKTKKKTGMYCDKRVGRWRDRASGRFVKGPTKCVKSTSKKKGIYCDTRVGRWRDRSNGRFVKGKGKCEKKTYTKRG